MGKNQADVTTHIDSDEKANSTIIIIVMRRALYLSGRPPNASIKAAEETVPAAYIAPQIE